MMIETKIFEISLPAAKIQHFEFLATRWIFRGERNHFFHFPHSIFGNNSLR